MFAEIGSSPLLAAVLFGVLAALAAVFLLWAVPKRIGVAQPLGTVVVLALVVVGLWVAFGASPPPATTTPAIAAGGSQFPAAFPSAPGPGPSGPSAQPSGSPPVPATCAPSGTKLEIAASGIAYDKRCLAAPANQAFTVTFTNRDAGTPHNFEIFTDPSAATRLGGAKDATDVVVGPGSTTYDVQALESGTYFFHCDIHPTQMSGTFIVP
jgi:hypothetical protein